ncbi:hypothetical protein QBC39DRAFT_129933 [Podospora conica]|nr:hypothetical protein QBC39DRAFT_129933 [Schizothecium conicum]
MEFLSGYASARAPLSAYQVEPHPKSQRANQPTRSNSTSGGSSIKKRSRIGGRGHIRTSSASTTNSSQRTETPSSPHSSFAWPHHHPPPPGSSTPSGVDPNAPQSSSGVAGAEILSAGHSVPPWEHQQDRMPASVNYYQNKQLPATPRLDTHLAASKYLATGAAPEPASARTPAPLDPTSATHSSSRGAVPQFLSSSVVNPQDRRAPQHAAMFPELAGNAYAFTASPIYPHRAESISSLSGATSVSSRTVPSSEPPSSAETAAHQLRPFVVRNGRTFNSDPTLPYPLPVDLEELHRQSLRTLLLVQLFGKPICSPAFANKPPTRVLEIGCGTGFWSMSCFRHYQARGQHSDIFFTGLDIAPIAPGSASPRPIDRTSSGGSSMLDGLPDAEMNWRFVQHDLRRLPLPFPPGEFDLVMVKDMSLATTTTMQQALMDEYLRVLMPGGTVEIWETDHTLRMLRYHVPESATAPGATVEDSSEESGSDDDLKEEVQGAYVMTPNTPLSAPLNNFLVEYNGWLSKALDRLSLCAVPCTLIGPMLIQEAEVLTTHGSCRFAVPLSEVRWEREGVGGVVTKDGKSYIETKGRRAGKDGGRGQSLDPEAAALRRTALLTVVQMIQSLEHVLRDVSGKSQDEWDTWLGKMMNNLIKENGTRWGECLEVGAWWARKRG